MLNSKNHCLATFKGVKFIFTSSETYSSLDIETIPKRVKCKFSELFFFNVQIIEVYNYQDLFILGESEEL